jgi:hypothetical protein
VLFRDQCEVKYLLDANLTLEEMILLWKFRKNSVKSKIIGLFLFYEIILMMTSGGRNDLYLYFQTFHNFYFLFQNNL